MSTESDLNALMRALVIARTNEMRTNKRMLAAKVIYDAEGVEWKKANDALNAAQAAINAFTTETARREAAEEIKEEEECP